MQAAIEEQLQAIGFAKVLMTIEPAAAGEMEAASLEALFTPPTSGQQAQMASLGFAAARSAGRQRRAAAPRLRVFRRLGLAIGVVDRDTADALQGDNRVQGMQLASELSLIRPVAAAAAAPPSTIAWGLRRLGAPALWQAGFDGTGVIVGHLDTGVDGAHPALAGAISAFAEFDLAGNQVPRAQPHDSGEHGTHTAGTIVGRPTARGAIGMAPGAQLASALVIEGGQVIDRVLGGLEWVLSRNVRVISMSLGLRGYTPAFQAVIDALRRNNVLPVFAVGNEGPDTSRSPGNYDNVLSIGAMDGTDQVPDWSSSQAFQRALKPLVPDCVAPGVEILSAKPGGDYQTMSGSSMATPHVAGLAALLLQAKPDATVDALEQAILASCVRPASMPEARANHGVPDAARAYAALLGQPPAASGETAVARPAAKRMSNALAEALARLMRRNSEGAPLSGKRGAPAKRAPAKHPRIAAAKTRAAATAKPGPKPKGKKLPRAKPLAPAAGRTRRK